MIKNDRIRFTYRVVLALISVYALLMRHYIDITIEKFTILDSLAHYKYYTWQSNSLVFIWLVLAIIYNSSPEKLNKISGFLKGAIVSYISFTFVVFALFVETGDPLTAPNSVSIFSHYLIPVAFILDFILFDFKEFDWKYIPYWLIYPILYIGFLFTYGSLVSIGIFGIPNVPTETAYIYPFFDIEKYGIVGFLITAFVLVVFYLCLAFVVVGISKVKAKYSVNS